MLDTVKLGIPLTPRQFQRIQEKALLSSTPQWAIFHPDTGEVRLRRVNGLATTDQNSFHREIKWDVPYCYSESGTYLTVELSLPKLYYGHNIHLLYNWVAGLEVLKDVLEKSFGLRGRGKLISLYEWRLWRVDVCYAWDCISELIARQVIDSLTHLHFPRKKPHIYPGEALLFAGTTYSLKFYRKLPEFRKHDLKVLLKSGAALEWINHCEDIATGVVRVEATLRGKYLKKRGIKTVADLLEPMVEYEFNTEEHPKGFDYETAIFAITAHHSERDEAGDWDSVVYDSEDGECFNLPEGYEFEYWTSEGKFIYRHTGSGFILRKTDQPTAILQYLLVKFLGANPGMQHTDEVEALLNDAFKPVKAARLMAMWLYVQRFGTDRAKEAFGKDSYYASRRDMKNAGVSLIEPPKNVVRLEPKFWEKFKVQVPSEYVTNRVDDFRDSGNILNLPTAASDGQ
jgi:Phage replication protein CRI